MTFIIGPKQFNITAGKSYVGQTRPGGSTSFLPAPGFMAPVGVNNMQDVFDVNNPNPLLRGSAAILNAWNSTIYAKDFGPMGAIIAFGGGHTDYMGNDVYAHDIATQTWSRIVDPTPLGISAQDYDTVAQAGITGEYWIDDTRSGVIVGKIAPPHSYGNFKYVSAAIAGNTKGWVVMMGGFCNIAHYIDLDDLATGWQRLGGFWSDTVPGTQNSNYGSALVDTKRGWIASYPAAPNGQSRAVTLTAATKAVSSIWSDYPNSYYSVSDYCVSDDLYMTFILYPHQGESFMNVFDPTLPEGPGTKFTPPTSGFVPYPTTTAEWVESLRSWVTWDGTTSDLYKCTAPANPRTDTWVWTKMSFTNDTGVLQQTGAAPMYNRLHFIPALNAFAVVVAVNKQVQYWKL